jgi:hypothetical protein
MNAEIRPLTRNLPHMETLREAPANVVPSSRAWYGATIAEFLRSAPDSVFAQLVSNGEFALLTTQKDAWLAQIDFLRACLIGLSGSLFLEFNIPRMGRRIDAVLLVGPVVFVVEFKVGETVFDRAAMDQVWDYALDLKNFHAPSHRLALVPILLATGATESMPIGLQADSDNVYRPIQVCSSGFREAIDLALATITGNVIEYEGWAQGSYRPTHHHRSGTGTLFPALRRSNRAPRRGSAEPTYHVPSHRRFGGRGERARTKTYLLRYRGSRRR